MTNEQKADILDCLVSTIKGNTWDDSCIGCRNVELCRYILEDEIWEDINRG